MQNETDLIDLLLRRAGRRSEPPLEAYRQVYAAATAAFRDKTVRRRERQWVLWASAAAVAVFAIALMFEWTPPSAGRSELARVERVIGLAEVASGDTWRTLGETGTPLTTGVRLRTLAGGRLALALGGGGSLRLDAETEVMLDAPGRLYVGRGTIYVDSGARPGASRLQVVTPAGTAHDIGTQFELQVAGSALRLRVREGSVSIDRGGRSLTGGAGEQIAIDALGGISRNVIEPDDEAWQWAESIAPTPDMDGRPAAELISWVARETGRELRYVSPNVEQRASSVILHGNIRNLAPLAALEAMLATTDLEYVLRGDTMEIRTRDTPPLDP
jgi:ferric-dicitrate binding protein FerR (iron transport regulator)